MLQISLFFCFALFAVSSCGIVKRNRYSSRNLFNAVSETNSSEFSTEGRPVFPNGDPLDFRKEISDILNGRRRPKIDSSSDEEDFNGVQELFQNRPGGLQFGGFGEGFEPTVFNGFILNDIFKNHGISYNRRFPFMNFRPFKKKPVISGLPPYQTPSVLEPPTTYEPPVNELPATYEPPTNELPTTEPSYATSPASKEANPLPKGVVKVTKPGPPTNGIFTKNL